MPTDDNEFYRETKHIVLYGVAIIATTAALGYYFEQKEKQTQHNPKPGQLEQIISKK